MAVQQKILAIIGATASGKSELALSVAQRAGAEILSIDSMQVYRGMDVGTAKPTQQEQAAVKHHMLDLVGPDETFTAARFVEQADMVIADARTRGVPLVATGGTPLYFKSLFQGLFAGPGADEAVRSRLRGQDAAELHRQLMAVDPAAAARIHIHDRKRMIRALEVHELTGKPISAFQTEWDSPEPRHNAVWVGLAWEKETLNRRINARVKQMIAGGWIDEVRRLLQRYGNFSATATEATGYRQIMEHLAGRQSLEEAIEQIKIATRQLARRQVKWFRRFANVTWVAGEKPLEEKAAAVMALWGKSGQSLQAGFGNGKGSR